MNNDSIIHVRGLRKFYGALEAAKEIDGNPLQDIHALSSISNVFVKGERVIRSELFEQK